MRLGDLLALPVLDELCLDAFGPALLFSQLDDGDHELDWVPPTDRIPGLVEVTCEVLEVLRLDELHALAVEALDRLVDHRLIRELMSELEALSPVAEVT